MCVTIAIFKFEKTELKKPLQVSLVLPEEVFEIVRQELDGDVGTVRYSRVNMSLSEIISGDFFNQYIKTGTICEHFKSTL